MGLLNRIWNSTFVRRLKAIWAFVLFIVDIATDFIVGYDMFKNCHTMYSAAAFAFCAFPGFLESLHRISTQAEHSDCLPFLFSQSFNIALLFLPFWMIPYTVWTLMKDVYRIKESTLINAKKWDPWFFNCELQEKVA